jgi:hypothetical protein
VHLRVPGSGALGPLVPPVLPSDGAHGAPSGPAHPVLGPSAAPRMCTRVSFSMSCDGVGLDRWPKEASRLLAQVLSPLLSVTLLLLMARCLSPKTVESLGNAAY